MMVRFEPYAFFLLRIVSGILFILHGTSKILHYPVVPNMPPHLPMIAVVAGILEIVFGLLITLGIFTTWAAFLASGEMAVAYFAGHALKGFWPIVNGGEPAMIFCFIFLYIFAHGPGIWSLTKK